MLIRKIYGHWPQISRTHTFADSVLDETHTQLSFSTDFILSIERASKLWLQICGWSRGGLSSAVSWSADSLHACWAGGAELWSSWVSGPGACTSYPKTCETDFQYSWKTLWQTGKHSSATDCNFVHFDFPKQCAQVRLCMSIFNDVLLLLLVRTSCSKMGCSSLM